MATWLYIKEHGWQKFEADRVRGALDAGWTVEEPAAAAAVEDPVTIAAVEEPIDFVAGVTMDVDDLRQRAKSAGIASWWRKSPEKLMEELKNEEEEGQKG